MKNNRVKKAGKSALDTFAYTVTIIFIFSILFKINLYNFSGNLFWIVVAVSLGAFIGEYRRSKTKDVWR